MSELREAQREVVETGTFLESVLDTSADAIFVVGPDRKPAFMNATARAIAAETDEGLPWNIASIDGDDPSRDAYPLVRALNGEEAVRTQVVTRVNGAVQTWDVDARPMRDSAGALVGAVAVCRDITEAQDRARRDAGRQAFIDSMLHSSADAIIAIDAEFVIRYSNSTAHDLFGAVVPGSRILDNPSDIASVDGEPPTADNLPLQRALNGETDVHTELVLGGASDGLIVEAVANPIATPDGTVVGAVSVYRDVSEERRVREREAAQRSFVDAMLDDLEEGIAALDVLTDEEYRNSAARGIGIPHPGSGEPLPFTMLDGSPVPEDLIFRAMSGDEEPPFEMQHAETGRVYLARTRGVRSAEGVLGAVFTASDITEMRGVTEQLQIQSAAMEATITAMFITDATGTIEWVNRAFTEMNGWSSDEAIGENPRILKSGRQGPAHYRELWETILSGKPWSGRVVNRKKDGTHYVVDQWVTPILDSSGAVTHFVAVHDDVTAQVEAEAKVLHLATHDVLTDLPNRRLFLEHLEGAVARARRHEQTLGVLMLDLDRFKDVNDTLGHQSGDELLRQVATRLKERVRRTDTVSRFGGDEFAVLVDDAGLEGVEQLAKDLIAALSSPFEVLGHTVRSGTSVGISMGNGESVPQRLLEEADMALYVAKDRERGTFALYAPEMGEHNRRLLELGSELGDAIRAGVLEIVYQPVFDLRTGRVSQLESLLRWPRPDGSLARPDEFLAAAAEQGILGDLGRWVLETVCKQVAEWRERGLQPPVVAINIADEERRNRRWGNSFARSLDALRVPASALAIEVTETAAMAAAEDNVRSIRALRSDGLHVTLDDFGTGLSSLLHFKRLPIDRMKLPRVFVADILSDTSSGALVRASALLAHSVRARLVAKGVETEAQLQEIRRLGCQEVQGHLLGSAMSAEEVAEVFQVAHPSFHGG